MAKVKKIGVFTKTLIASLYLLLCYKLPAIALSLLATCAIGYHIVNHSNSEPPTDKVKSKKVAHTPDFNY